MSEFNDGYEEALAALEELTAAPPAEEPSTPPQAPQSQDEDDDLDLIPDKEGEEQPQYVSAEEFGTLQAQFEAYQAQVEKMLSGRQDPQTQQRQQQQEPQPQTQYDDDPAMRYLTQHAQSINALWTHTAGILEANAKQTLNSAIAQKLAEHPDLHDYIKPEEIELEFDKAKKSGNLQNMQWGSVIETVYRNRSYDALKKQADQLAEMRARKAERAQQNAAAAQVPAGGANYQKPERKLDPSDRGYDSAYANALAHLNELGG